MDLISCKLINRGRISYFQSVRTDTIRVIYRNAVAIDKGLYLKATNVRFHVQCPETPDH